jgi:hypothetical protein
MKNSVVEVRHPVPKIYHQLLHIGKTDRKGNIVNFKIPPVIVDSPKSIDEYRKIILQEHVDAEDLPMLYEDAKSFMILRPTALPYKSFVRERLTQLGLLIYQEFALDNFVRFADILYEMNPCAPFHWQWRVIMRSLHDSGTQNQDKAFVFMLENGKDTENRHIKMMALKKSMREDMGETPVIVKYEGRTEIALGIHHLHSPDFNRVSIEYNTLMHAKHRTSVFS